MNNGLWKLAAMVAVIGVGLGAVYKAQQGLNPGIVATTQGDGSEDVGDSASPDESTEAGSSAAGMASVSPTADDNSTVQLDNPFEVKSTSVEKTTKSSSGTKKPKLPTEVPTAESVSDTQAQPRGLDFRGMEEEESGPSLGSPRSNKPVKKVGFEEGEPNRLPEDDNPFGVTPEKLPSASGPKLSTKRSTVRQANETRVVEEGKTGEVAADPFEGTKAEEKAKPVEAVPFEVNPTPKSSPSESDLQPTDKESPSAEEKEPLGATTLPDLIPTTESPTAAKEKNDDPFNDFSGKKFEAKTEPQSEPVVPSDPDPFGSGSAPPAIPAPTTPAPTAPADLPPSPASVGPSTDDSREENPFGVKPTAEPEPAPKPQTGSRQNPLPTSVPTKEEFPSEFGGPPPAAEPRDTGSRGSDSPTNRRRNDESVTPSQTDLIGDGTIDAAVPRGLQQPRLTIEKIAPKQAVLGEPLIYTVIVKNVGGSPASNVVVEDRIPKGSELTGTAPQADLVDKKLIWQLGTLKPDEESKISIRVIPRQEGSIGSVARVSFVAEVAAEIMVAAPQLAIKAKAPREVRIGETFEMLFTVKNTGGAAAKNVIVRDLLPEGLKHEAGTDIECPIGQLGPNDVREISLQVTAIKPGRVQNRATMKADGGISQEVASTIDVVGEHLVLTRSGNNRIYAERPVVFKNNVKNEGNAAVQTVKVSEVVPVGFEFVEATDGGRFDSASRTIQWTVGPLAPGAEADVSAKLIGKTPGVLTGRITAAGSTGSSATVNSEVEVVGRPELQMETLSATGLVAVGDKLTSKIQLKNTGSAPARNVGLSVSIPNELKLVEVRGARYRQKGNMVEFEPLDDLAPGKLARFELVMDAVAEANATMDLRISADHLSRPAQRTETVHISSEFK